MADNLFNPSSLFELLQSTGTLPRWAQHKPYSESTKGEYNPSTNQLVAYPVESDYTKSTLAHEMAHAVDFNVLYNIAQFIAQKKFNGGELSPVEEQFLDGYKKVRNEQIGPMGLFSSKENTRNKNSQQSMLPPGFVNDKYNSYRTSNAEALAFAVGNTSVKDPLNENDIRHFDPTKATEFSIMMDMYSRIPENVRKQALQSRMQNIEQARKEEKKSVYDRFVDVFSDPFKDKVR